MFQSDAGCVAAPRRCDLAPLFLLGFCFSLLLSVATAAEAEWRILALRVDFPRENPDELTTTGVGAFDLRSVEDTTKDYALPYDLPPHDRTYFERHLTALARYYEVVSEGRVEISSEVFPRAARQAYTLPQSMLHYGNGRTTEEIGVKWIELVRDALHAAQADPDGPRLDEFNSFLVFHAGVGYETGELNDIRSVFLSENDFADFNGGPLVVDGVEINQAWILPESPSLDGRAGLNGLLAKFFGHQLGLPGLSNFAASAPALGSWSLMDVGANVSGYVRTDSLAWVVGFAPPHPMAWSKIQLGWIEPVVVRRDTVLSLLATDRSGDLPKAVRIPIDAREYFLLENRQQRGQRGVVEDEDEEKVWIDPDQEVTIEEGVWTAVEEYDVFVPGSGVLIWHVDEDVMARAEDSSTVNNQAYWQAIALEEADGYRDIGHPVFERQGQIEGSPDDPFFVGGQTLFGSATRPDSRSNREWETGIEIEVLSAPGDTMQVAILFGRVRPGWPRDLPGDGRLQAADLDGDGVEELLFEAGGGVGYATGDGVAAWRIPQARLLAAGAGDGQPAIFLRSDAEVSAWAVGADQPLWQLALDEVPLDARFSVGAEAELLLVGVEQTYVVDAISGELEEQRPLMVPSAVGDLDGDGQVEQVFAATGGQVEIGSQAVELGDSLTAPPVLGDLDGDGLLEVVLLARGGAIHALRADGLRQADFPAFLPSFAEVGDLVFEPVLCDVDADGKQEIFVAGHSGIFGVDDDGRLLPGFPLLTAAPPTASPVVVGLRRRWPLGVGSLGWRRPCMRGICSG